VQFAIPPLAKSGLAGRSFRVTAFASLRSLPNPHAPMSLAKADAIRADEAHRRTLEPWLFG
jgi:hypothetical protein